MTSNKLMSKSVFVLLVLLIAGVSSANIRTLLWDDNNCASWSKDGTKCLACAPRCIVGKYGKCQRVSDNCKEWDNCTGLCTCCYPGWGAPVNGVCGGIVTTPPPVVDDHCAKYGYVDAKQKFYSSWVDGCKKVCIECDCDYYLNCDYKCIKLPAYCKSADKWGNCTSCEKGYKVDCGKCVKEVIISEPADHCVEYGWIDSAKKWYTYEVKGCQKVCKCCEKGYYLDSSYKCVKLPKHCKEVDSKGKCIKCSNGYELDKNCVCVKIDDHCAEYVWIDANQKTYSYEVKGCKKVCKCCDKGYYLDCDNKCVKLPENCEKADKYGKCTECCKGYVFKGDKCIVEDHCEEYGWVDAGNKWYSSEVKGCKKVCKCCEKGYYLDCDYKCVKLPENCEKADKYGKCTECCKGFVFKGDKCVVDDHCEEYGWVDSGDRWYSSEVKGCKKVCKCCEKGYYLDCDYKCVKLPDYCEKANKQGKCTECCKGYKLIEGVCKVDDHCEEYGWIDAGKKWSATYVKGCEKVCKCCEKGYYLDCDYKCVKLPDYCEKANKYGECTECCKGYKLIEGVCKVDDHCEEYGWLDAGKKWQKTYVKGCLKVCKCCEKGFYLDCDNKCVKLPDNCEQVKQGKCTECCKGYELCDGKCVEKKKDNRRY